MVFFSNVVTLYFHCVYEISNEQLILEVFIQKLTFSDHELWPNVDFSHLAVDAKCIYSVILEALYKNFTKISEVNVDIRDRFVLLFMSLHLYFVL